MENDGELAEVRRRYGSDAWRAEAWPYYDMVPQLRYGVGYVGDSLSQVTLRVGWEGDDGEVGPIIDDEGNLIEQAVEAGVTQADYDLAVDLVHRLRSRQGGQGALLRKLAQCLLMAGECELLGSTSAGSSVPVWEICSTDELRPSSSYTGWARYPGPGLTPIPLDPLRTIVIRIWCPHPRWSQLADSPVRANLEVLEELALYSRAARAAAVSRLTGGAGVYWIPQEITFANNLGGSGSTDPTRNQFSDDLLSTMAAPLYDRSAAASFAPMVATAPGQFISQIRHDTFDSPLDSTLWMRRTEAVGHLAQGLPLPAEVITGTGGANHWCCPSDTEILTTEGWKTHDQLDVGDSALTLNHATGLAEWQPVAAVNRFDVVDEPMLSMESRVHSSLTTMNHRWPVLEDRPDDFQPGNRDSDHAQVLRGWRTSRGLQQSTGWQLIQAAPCADVPVDAKYSDAFVELVGWLWTEGSISERPGRLAPAVTIYQSHVVNPQHVARIRAALTSVFGPIDNVAAATNYIAGRYGDPWNTPELGSGGRAGMGVGVSDGVPRWKEYQRANGMTQFTLNTVASAPLAAIAPKRRVSLAFIRSLTAAQLELFINVSVWADGTEGPTRTLSQSSRDMLDALELAVILSGRAPHIYMKKTHHADHLGGDSWLLSIQNRVAVAPKPANQQVTAYTGTVWCPTTANGSWLMRRNGTVCFTGNSAWHLDEQTVKAHLGPFIEVISASIDGAYLHPFLLAGLGNPNPFAAEVPEGLSRMRVWPDLTRLISHPNREAAADKAYGTAHRPNFGISDATYRRWVGATEEDAPDDEEIIKRIRIAQLVNERITARGAETDDQATDNINAGDSSGSGEVEAGIPGSDPTGAAGTDAGQSNDSTTASASLIADLSTMADQAAERAVHRAAAKVRTKLSRMNGKSPVAANLLATHNSDLCAVVGKSIVMPILAADDPRGLFPGEWDALVTTVTRRALLARHPNPSGLAAQIAGVAEATARLRLFDPRAVVPVDTVATLVTERSGRA